MTMPNSTDTPIWNEMKGNTFMFESQIGWNETLGRAEAALYRHDLEISRAKRRWDKIVNPNKSRNLKRR